MGRIRYDNVCMSNYGRLWQKVADIRETLRKAIPGSNTSTLEEARASVKRAGRMGEFGGLLADWELYERMMAQTDD